LKNIIGIGTVGCSVAKAFSAYPQYKIYTIDNDGEPEKGFYKLPKLKTPEEYENTPIKLGSFFKGLKGESLVVLSGASIVSGAALVIMEQVARKTPIKVLYIQPEMELLGEIKTKQERVVYNVLQQYARSALLERMYLVSNPSIEFAAESAGIYDYHRFLNDFIASTINMINIFDRQQPISSTMSPPASVSRICTLSVVSPEDNEEKVFFPLDNTREIRYYYCIPEEKLRTDPRLYRKVVEAVKQKMTDSTKVSYGIYSTNYEFDLIYGIHYSSRIQSS